MPIRDVLNERAPPFVPLTALKNLIPLSGCRELAIGFCCVGVCYVVIHHSDESVHYAITTKRGHQAAIDVYRSNRFFKCAWKRNADIGVFRFSGTIHYTTHDRDLHLFHTWMPLAPERHLFAQIALNLFGHFLEECARSPAAAGTGGHLRREDRSSRDCRICWHTITSSVRSPFGAGVSETRMVSPIPSCSRTDKPAVDATIPFAPMPGFG